MRRFAVSLLAVLFSECGGSPPLSAADTDLLRLTVQAFHAQRCGTNVDIGNGYRYQACHRKSAFHPSARAISSSLPVHKGWHDAGDYGRYVVNSGIATGTLLWAYELFPEPLRDLNLLDEIRWNLEWMLSMQDADGGVWHKQTSLAFPPFVMPHDDDTTSHVIGKSSCATANLAAVAAIAARIYEGEFAQANLAASRRAWKWLQKHPNVTFKNPPDVATGEYGDEDCSDERLWAAAELWRTSGDAGARVWVRRNIGASETGPPSWNETGPLALWRIALSGDAEARRRVIAAADVLVARAARNRWRTPMRTADFEWGSNGVAANYAMQLLVTNEIKRDPRYVNAAADILAYLTGNNPFALSFVTGHGAKSVMHPHHRPSGADGIAAPWPGLLAGGPNRNRQDPVLKKMPRNTPPIEMYADDQESYASNEIAINWNAPLVFLLAGLEQNRD
ncbi:MAG TPA: glycoside hydrolase family 9 protein [Thermoanaerobaculia bacterium]|nr:glycoside hydrolase family 9 protein [Thermoanaerobaculia bacterium]